MCVYFMREMTRAEVKRQLGSIVVGKVSEGGDCSWVVTKTITEIS